VIDSNQIFYVWASDTDTYVDNGGDEYVLVN
jgi:hypothetical protein